MMQKHNWSDEDIAYLRQNYAAVDTMLLCRYFGVSETSLHIKARSLGLRKSNKTAHKWSEEDLLYLREHYPLESGGDIADRLGVSSTLVYKKARELGLKKSSSFNRNDYSGRYTRNYRHTV